MENEKKIALTLELTEEEELVLEVCLRLVASDILNEVELTQEKFKSILLNVVKDKFGDENIRSLLDAKLLNIDIKEPQDQ